MLKVTNKTLNKITVSMNISADYVKIEPISTFCAELELLGYLNVLGEVNLLGHMTVHPSHFPPISLILQTLSCEEILIL